MAGTVRGVGTFIAILGVLSAIAAFAVEHSSGYDSDPIRGLLFACVVFVPTLFMWGVLVGIAEIMESLAG